MTRACSALRRMLALTFVVGVGPAIAQDDAAPPPSPPPAAAAPPAAAPPDVEPASDDEAPPPVRARPGAGAPKPKKSPKPRASDEADDFIEAIDEVDDGTQDSPATEPVTTPTTTPGTTRPTTGTKPPAERASSPPRTGDPSSVVVVKPLSADGLVERFTMFAGAMKSTDPSEKKRAAGLVEEGLLELGLVGRSGHVQARELATAAVVLARRARDEGRTEDAILAMDLARTLAPDAPLVHHERLRFALTDVDPALGVEAIGDLARAVVARTDAAVAAVLIATLIFLVALTVLLFVTGLLAIAKVFRLVVFDLHNALPRGIARWQLGAVLAVLLALPLLAGLGPIVTPLVWLLVASLYLDGRQRSLTGLVLAGVVALPFVVEVAARLAGFAESDLGRAHRAYVELTDDAGREVLRARDTATLPVMALAALGEDALREGRLEEAKEWFRACLARANDDAWTHHALGVVAALEGNIELADASFKDAHARDAALVAAPFNRALLASRSGKPPPPDVDPDALAAQAPDEVERLRRLTFRGADERLAQTRAYALAPVRAPTVLDVARTESEGSRARTAEASSALFFGLPVRVAAIAFAVVLAVFLLLGRLVRVVQPSTPCGRCGGPSGRRYDGDKVPAGTCSACFHAFVRKDGTLDAGMRVLKERQGVTYRRRTRALTRAAALVVPAGGHHLEAAAVRGIVGTFVVVSLLTFALGWPMLSHFWPGLLLEGANPLQLGALGTAILLHVVLVWDAFQLSE